MTLIRVDRYLSTAEATLSRVFVDGAEFCYGLEDEFRAAKVAAETRIRAGVYKVALKDFGTFHERYAKDRRFRDIHIGMLWVRGVPDFENILIHVGNTDRDTAGCLLVGDERDELRMTLSGSAAAYRRLYLRVRTAAERGELRIEYEDNDR